MDQTRVAPGTTLTFGAAMNAILGLNPISPNTEPCHSALALTKGGPTTLIELNGQFYTLRITRQGKLILTK